MSLIGLVLTLVVIGVCLYFVEKYIPMAEPIKILIRVVIVICIVLFLLNAFGIVGPMVPSLRR